ncbi:phosphonate ABC transporter, permease protein PhnE [Natronosporangium hydrolyticum]|nr:phosphonate ABC transporter, permease protein PhnE [Natronosporangium hydrolyticum]
MLRSDRDPHAAGRLPLHRGDRPQPPGKTRQTIGLLLVLGVVLVCFWLVDARWGRLIEAPPILADYFELMAQGVFQNPVEDPTVGYWQRAFDLMLESLYMAWIGTMIGALLSFPLAFLAAENVAPKPVVFVTRQFLNAIRAIPELIFAIAIMLPIFGLGPLAGALALGVGSVGTLGKLTSEVIEGTDRGPVEAARASGAGFLATLRWSIVPQALPETIAFWLYRFEINIRAGAVLGVLGAGGIGSILSDLFRVRAWDRIGITLLVIIVVTVIIDQISARVRNRIIQGPGVSARSTQLQPVTGPAAA